MSTQQSPLTYEGILEMFRETREQFRESREEFQVMREQMKESDRRFDRRLQKSRREFDRRMKETDRKIGKLGSRIGDIIENMVSGNIVDKFQALDYEVTQCSRKRSFAHKKLGIRGEVDLFLENGEVAILIEVKTTLETADVRNHIERIEKYRRYANATSGDKRRFIGAVAGAVVEGEAETFAQENGMYVIVQSGDAVEIVPPPAGFAAKEW